MPQPAPYALARQPVIKLLILLRRIIPGEVHSHAAVDDLVPLALLIIIDMLCVADCMHHLMGVVIGETEAGSPVLVLIIGLYRILQARCV